MAPSTSRPGIQPFASRWIALSQPGPSRDIRIPLLASPILRARIFLTSRDLSARQE